MRKHILFLITLFCDTSPFTQGLLWLPPSAAVVSIFPEKASFKEGEKGHHQSEHGKGKSRPEGSLWGPAIPEGDWAWKVKVEAGRDVVSLGVSGALGKRQSSSGDCRSEEPQDVASWLQSMATWLSISFFPAGDETRIWMERVKPEEREAGQAVSLAALGAGLSLNTQ